MRKIKAVLVVAIILSCTTTEKPLKTFTAHQVSEDNGFSFRTVRVKVNPDLKYLNISGEIEKDKNWEDPTNREFYIFTRPGIKNLILIEKHTRIQPHSFYGSQSVLTKKMEVIQKGSKLISGKTWELYIRSVHEFPEYIFSAVNQKGVNIEKYRCGIEIGAARIIDRFNRLQIRYIKGIDECQSLPQNGGYLSDDQLRLVQEFANEFDENITIEN